MGDAEAKAGYYTLGIGSERKGGFTASTFVFAFTALENMGFVAIMVSMFMYFRQVMLFDLSTAANTLTNLMGSTFLLSLIGGFISDTYLSRLYTCLVFGVVEILALVLMTIQAYSHDLHPSPCGKSNCDLEGGIALVFYLSLCMLALGSGGVRGSLPALGGDQFDQKNPKEAKDLASFFNWILLSTTIGAAVGVTVIVWVSVNVNWYWGFFISSVAALAGLVILGVGKPFYRLRAPGESPIIRIIQVIVVAIKNRKLPLPEKPDHFYEIMSEEGTISTGEQIAHTHQFRFLDKAAILREDSEPAPWTVCTATQVEEVKILTRMLPIVASTIIMNTCLAQLQTFSIQQGNMMDRHLGSMEFPAPSIPVIPLVFMSILIPIYEFFFVPLARKFTHHPSGITQLQRVGVGLVLSAISMAIAAIVEVKRRNQATKLGPSTKPLISLFWLSFQYGIFGIADMFTLVGLLEFFYKEAPAGMRSLSTSLTWLSLSFGYFLSSVFVDVINAVTKRKGKKGWLHGYNLNENNLDLFYWFLAVLSCLNFLNYLYWASWYKYKAEVPDSNPKPQALYGPNLVDDESSALDNDQAKAICGATHAKDEIPQENEAKNNEACSSDLKEAGND